VNDNLYNLKPLGNLEDSPRPSIKKKVFVGVIVGHVIVIIAMALSGVFTPTRPPMPEKLLVTTITLKKPTATKASPPQKKSSPTKTSKEKPSSSQKDKKLIRSLKESIAKIDDTPHNIPRERITVVPKTIDTLNIDAVAAAKGKRLSVDDESYQEVLIRKLKTSLVLPEYGAVKVSLTISRNGTVEDIVVLSAESTKNKKYVERSLPSFVFRPFGSSFQGQGNHAFLVVLSNDM
jgi:hypothetical protein